LPRAKSLISAESDLDELLNVGSLTTLTLLSLRAGLPVEQPLRGGGDLHGRVLVYRRGLRWQILIELVALHFALLETHRQVQAETAQSAEAVQLVLLAWQTVTDLDVPQVDR